MSNLKDEKDPASAAVVEKAEGFFKRNATAIVLGTLAGGVGVAALIGVLGADEFERAVSGGLSEKETWKQRSLREQADRVVPVGVAKDGDIVDRDEFMRSGPIEMLIGKRDSYRKAGLNDRADEYDYWIQARKPAPSMESLREQAKRIQRGRSYADDAEEYARRARAGGT